jgi:hypothetical protein
MNSPEPPSFFCPFGAAGDGAHLVAVGRDRDGSIGFTKIACGPAAPYECRRSLPQASDSQKKDGVWGIPSPALNFPF